MRTSIETMGLGRHLLLRSGRAEDSIKAVLSLLVLPHVLQGQLVRDDERLLLAPAPLKLQHRSHTRIDTDLALHVLHHVEVFLAHDALILHREVHTVSGVHVMQQKTR